MSLREEGADILDIGGESTRPGATRPLVAEELGRVVPVIRVLASEGVPVSVDTMRHEVAEAALEAGAVLVNDVSGGLADPRLLDVVADRGASFVAMHWRGHSEVMQQHASYDDVVADVRAELAQRVEEAVARGVAEDRIVVDPGLGFAKTAEHNWELLGAVARAGQPGGAGARGLQPQVVPRHAPGRARRHAATRVGPRGRGGRADHDRGDAARLGGPGPRGACQRRRGHGGVQVAGVIGCSSVLAAGPGDGARGRSGAGSAAGSVDAP